MYTARSVGVSRSRTTSSADASSSTRCTPASGSPPGSTSSGTQGPSGVWRRDRADRATFRASRAVARDRKATGLITTERSVNCQRSHMSWTTSSASTSLPTIRYAVPKRRGRSPSKAAAVASRAPSPAAGRVSGRLRGRSVDTLITAPFRLWHPSMPSGTRSRRSPRRDAPEDAWSAAPGAPGPLPRGPRRTPSHRPVPGLRPWPPSPRAGRRRAACGR